jgi:hypothetical protein
MGRFRANDDDDDDDDNGEEPSSNGCTTDCDSGDSSTSLPMVVTHLSQQTERRRPTNAVDDATHDHTTTATTTTMPYWYDSRECFYYDNNSNNNRRNCCNPMMFRVSSIVAIFVAILCHAYLPPAPPPPTTTNPLLGAFYAESTDHNRMGGDQEEFLTWRSYLSWHSRHIVSSTKALLIETPIYVLSWLGISVYRDLQSTYEAATSTSTTTDGCSWQIPRSMDVVQRDLSALVLGQPLAVERLAEALVGWDQTKPLSMWSIGGPSTGKTTLVRAIVALYCVTPGPLVTTTTATKQQPPPEIELTIAEDDPRTIQQKRHRIQQHIHQHPHASVIIYRHHDYHHDEHLLSLLDDTNHNGENSPSNANNVILYRISTTLGRSILAQHLRARSWSSPSMMADLRAELHSLDHNNNNMPKQKATTNVILPFAPLTPTVLEAIVRHHYELDDESLWHSSAVEYIDWKTKHGELVMTIAMDGAQGLPWNRIRALQAERKTTTSSQVQQSLSSLQQQEYGERV